MLSKVFLLLLLMAGISMSVYAQIDAPPPMVVEEKEVVKVNTQLVDVPIVITDKTGKPLLNLKENNFVIYEDGKKQQLESFRTTAAPFEVALLLDTSGSTRADLRLITRAAEDFINSLRPGDKVSIIAFNNFRASNRLVSGSEILIPLTADRNKLKIALANVKTSNGTPFYDGVLQVTEEVFKNKPSEEFRGRRAFVALTDGVDSSSVAGFSEIREDLSRAGIISYFIKVDTRDFFEDKLFGNCQISNNLSQAQIRRYYRTFYPNSKIEKVFDFCKVGDFERLDMTKRLYELADAEMQNLSKISGGKVFPAAYLNEAQNAFRKVAEEIGTKYSLGYYSSNENRDGSRRKIKVELKDVPAGVEIRSRESYTAPNN